MVVYVGRVEISIRRNKELLRLFWENHRSQVGQKHGLQLAVLQPLPTVLCLSHYSSLFFFLFFFKERGGNGLNSCLSFANVEP